MAQGWSQVSCSDLFSKTIDPRAMLLSKNLDPQKISVRIDSADLFPKNYRGQVRIFYAGSEVFWGKIYETTAENGIGRIVINTWNESFPQPEFRGTGLASLAYLIVADHFFRTEGLVLTSDDFYKGKLNDTLSSTAQKQWDGFRSRGLLKLNNPEGRFGEFDPNVIQSVVFEELIHFAKQYLVIDPHDPTGINRRN